MRVLLGVTGSVATTMLPKLVSALHRAGHEVKIVYTDSSVCFFDRRAELDQPTVCYGDKDEYPGQFMYSKGDPITHIDLADWGEVFLIAPCSANTMAKVSVGVCDNLLTSVARCWDRAKPIWLAPAMNTRMWLNPVTRANLAGLKAQKVKVIWPSVAKLACGDFGIGRMADLEVIVALVGGYKWGNPFPSDSTVPNSVFVPTNHHPGAFGFERKHYVHPGVDLYHYDYESDRPVASMSNGVVVDVAPFTGQHTDPPSPWWRDTWHVSVYDLTLGLNIVYGEIRPLEGLRPGTYLRRGDLLGHVEPVLKNAPKDPPKGHSTHMLHVELSRFPETCTPVWPLGQDRDRVIADPTPLLMHSAGFTSIIDGYRG